MMRGVVTNLLVLALLLVACTGAGSRDKSGNRERTGAARQEPANERLPSDARPAPPRVAHIAAGGEHTCVLFDGGNVRCWGKGADGRLGTGAMANIGDDETPAAIPDVALGGRAVQISAGNGHTCALLDTGKVRCWGDNEDGQLGYGHTHDIGDTEAPASAGDVPLDEPVTQVVAGGFQYTCALLASGRVRCWGHSSKGQNGQGFDDSNIGDDEVPTAYPALELGGRVTQLVGGLKSPCALLDGGRVRCWGGVVGSGPGDRYTPPAQRPLVDLGVPAVRLGAGALHFCAITAAGRLRCWGGGLDGVIGYGVENVDVGVAQGRLPTPASLGDVPLAGDGRVTGVAPGDYHTCALLDTGGVRCWGNGRSGALGPASAKRVLARDAVEIDVGGRVVEMASGDSHTCVLLDTGGVRCWGSNSDGQLGYGRAENVGEPRSPAAAGDVPL